jgi:hypothetical protein
VIVLVIWLGSQTQTSVTPPPVTKSYTVELPLEAAAPEQTDAEAPAPVYKTTAQELVLAYDRNEVATNKKIGDSAVEIRGQIGSIDMDAMDHAVIQMVTGVELESVGLTLDDSQKDLAATLVKGQEIVIRCNKMARILTSPQGDDCLVVR